MININLLPEELRRIERKRKIRVNVTVFAGIAVVVAIAVIVVIFYLIGQRIRNLAEVKARLTKITPKSDEAEALIRKKSRIEKEINMIDDFGTRRLLWNRRLSEISDCMPGGLFLVSMSYKDSNSYIMVIKGEAPSEGGSELLNEFIDNLRETPAFAKEFSRFNSSIESLPDGRKAFEIRCQRVKK